MFPSASSRRPLGDDSGNKMAIHPQDFKDSSEPSPKKLENAASPSSGPFASTLQKEHGDLSEQSLRDLNRHKVSRELAEQVFSRWKTDASITANFNIDNIPTHPDLVESVSSCSETSFFALHSRQNSAELAAGDAKADSLSSNDEATLSKNRPRLHIRIPPSQLHVARSSPVGLGLNNHNFMSYQQPAPTFHDRIQAAIPNEAATDLSQQAIDTLLDSILPHHQAEYERDLYKMEVEELSRQSSTSSKAGRRRPQNILQNSSPVTEDIVRMDFTDTERNGNHNLRRAGGIYETPGNSPRNTQTPSPGQLRNGSSTLSSALDNVHPRERENILRDLADRLLVGVYKRDRSQSGPPTMENTGVLDRNSTFQTEPSGTSFASIFTVQMPAAGYGAPLTRLGRPLVPDGIATDKFTVVATYHPSYRHLVVDVLDYCHCPVGFDSSQIVDLMYLQNCGYLPPYCIWPVQSYSSERYQVTSQWSLCTTNANGIDILYVSDLDVLVQRIACCMFRANEARSMSKAGHRRYLDSISGGCDDACEVELFSKVTRLAREPMFTTVLVDYYQSAVLDWMPLNADPEHQLPHSRNGMPIRQF